MLDIKAPATGDGKGLLIPRITVNQRTNANAALAGGLLNDAGELRGGPAHGLLVYQTDGAQGLYYNTSQSATPSWAYLGDTAGLLVSNAWAAADATTNYLPRTGGTMHGTLNMNANIISNVTHLDFSGNGTAVGRSANGDDWGTAVGRDAYGYQGVAIGCFATGNQGVAVGGAAIGAGYGVAVGQIAQGSNCGVAVGRQADGTRWGVAIGYTANGFGTGVAVGASANGTNFGVAIGYGATGENNGTAVGRQANGSGSGAALGYLADGNNYGVAIGYNARGQTNRVAIGKDAYASGVNAVAIGKDVTNTLDNTTRLRGDLYLDGGTSIYTNGSFGGSGWGVKAFTIDHPLDPENKLLRHYCLESPEVWNVYAGNVQLVNGRAIIQLPDYYSALNLVGSEIYALTPIGGLAQLAIGKEVTDNHFTIIGDKDVKVSWSIKVLRNDPGCLEDLKRRPPEEWK